MTKFAARAIARGGLSWVTPIYSSRRGNAVRATIRVCSAVKRPDAERKKVTAK